LEREGVVDLQVDGGGVRARTRPLTPPKPRPDHRSALARELDDARDVQRRLLPQDCPPMPGVEYAGFCRPALAVGGDYYDFIRLSDTRLAIAIADVCGKGIPAALLMATLRAFLRGQTLHNVACPAEVVRTLNQLVCGSFSSNRFATFFFGSYDSSTRTLRYVNAGHPPPLVCGQRDGRRQLVQLQEGGPVVGLSPDAAFDEGHVQLEAGDLLVAYTDGISEAWNEAGDEWGDEAVQQLVRGCRELSPADVVTRITRGADMFAAGASQHDDMTVVAVRVAVSS
jgi:sigma-B regulation protein RsbU (phosphoserine phosphatase)